MEDTERIKYEHAIAEINEAQKEIRHRETLLKSLNETAALLLSNDMSQPMDTIRKCMEIIGDYIKVDRINIWKSVEVDGMPQYYRDFGWENEYTQKSIPLEKTMSTFPFMKMNQDWYNILKKGGIINATIDELPDKVRERLEPVGVKAILFISVFLQDEYWGYVSYDNCHETVCFKDEEADILRSSSLLMASALARREMMEQLIEAREEALLGTKAKTDFLANMSHEIRTPLNAVIGMTSIGQNAASLERKDYCFGKIEDASKHLLGIINDILDMSKIEANKLELVDVPFEFEKMLQSVVNVSSFRIEEKKQNFMVYIDEEIPSLLVGDDQRLAQIIANLLSNAVKFTPEGGSISIKTKLVAAEGDLMTIRFEVKDTGIGIDAEQQKKLFQDFQQADSATSRNYGGTGLGLAISKRIVEFMSGEIWIESEVGKGSNFIFTVKLKKAAKKEKQHKQKDCVTLENLRVLFVDDDAAVREYIEDIASRLGFMCDVADGGEQALSMINENEPYNIFFIDWRMPGIDGVQLCEYIRKKVGATPIIIMISSYEMAEIENQAKAAGIDRFLPKPIFPSMIEGIIKECLCKEGEEGADDEAEDSDDFEGASILLVDDVEINREIVIALLEPMSLVISCAENGRQALEMYSEAPLDYDLILMDVQMPVMDGYEATQKIRSLETDNASEIPIIAMTANVFKEDVEHCLDTGMNAHLSKPLNLDDVVSVLRKYLKPASKRQGAV